MDKAIYFRIRAKAQNFADQREKMFDCLLSKDEVMDIAIHICGTELQKIAKNKTKQELLEEIRKLVLF